MYWLFVTEEQWTLLPVSAPVCVCVCVYVYVLVFFLLVAV